MEREQLSVSQRLKDKDDVLLAVAYFGLEETFLPVFSLKMQLCSLSSV